MLLNLFDVAAHFSPRLWFWAHFTKNLFQNSWLGVIMVVKQSSHYIVGYAWPEITTFPLHCKI